MVNGAAIEGLIALRRKYQRMLAMRRVHASGVAHDPREQMRALALEFPGALREIDELPLPIIEDRMRALDGVIDQDAAPQPWMLWMVDYHGHLRSALRLKRMGLSLHDLDSALTQLRRDYVPAADEPPVERFAERTSLAAVLKPVDGRLNSWAFAQIAERHGVGVHEVERTLFPARRSRR